MESILENANADITCKQGLNCAETSRVLLTTNFVITCALGNMNSNAQEAPAYNEFG